VRTKSIIDFILLAACWGGSYLFIRLTVGYVTPMVMTESRLIVGTIGIGLIALFNRDWLSHLIPYRKDLSKIIAISLFNSVIPFGLFAYAMQTLNAGLGAILNSTSPIWAAVIGAIWLKDRLSFSRIFGLMMGVVGIVILMWGKAHFSTGGLALPFICCMGLTFCYGLASNLIKVYGQDMHSMSLTFSSLFIGAAMLAIPAWMELPQEPLPISVWVGILGLGIFSTAVGYILFFRLVKDTSPSIAISVTFLVPVFSVIWGFIFLDEQPTLQMFVGGLIIVLGTSLAVGLVKFSKKITLTAQP
jgi:drug/metabolite transporter (DMT)-like permease